MKGFSPAAPGGLSRSQANAAGEILSDVRVAALATAKQLTRCTLPPVGDRALMAHVAGALGDTAQAAVTLSPTSTVDFLVPVVGSTLSLAVMVRTGPHWDRAMLRLMIDRLARDDRIGGIIVVARSNMLMPREANGKPVHIVLAGRA